jgi:hypothetical protein
MTASRDWDAGKENRAAPGASRFLNLPSNALFSHRRANPAGTAVQAAPPSRVLTRRSGVASGGGNDKDKLIRPPITIEAEGWATASGLTQREAEELLDWLEANGFNQREVVYTPSAGITVRWRR